MKRLASHAALFSHFQQILAKWLLLLVGVSHALLLSRWRSLLPALVWRCYSTNPTGPPAFVLDIDGVLKRGRETLPAALKALEQLCVNGTWRYPVCFLTNGGGVTEARKAQQLSQWLGVPVHEHQVILSHTPMRALAATLAQQPVLVVGRHEVVEVAASYGFQKVLTTRQLAAAHPGALPFLKADAMPQQGGGVCPVRDLGWGTATHPLAAVLVMSDPTGTDWYQDLQLLTDVITSHGVPKQQKPAPGSRPVELYFSNPDLVWATDYCRPRFGQGAFSSMLDAVHRQLTGTPLPNARWFGKPNPEPYRIAEQLLAQQAAQLGLISAQEAAAVVNSSTCSINHSDHGEGQHPVSSSTRQQQGQTTSGSRSSSSELPSSPFSAIFAVGDNPAADIRGANMAGQPWVSVLVRTGVFQGQHNDERDPAHIVVTDVLAAVQAGLHRARSSKWHSMR